MSGPRISVPPLFDGNWDTVVICTYGADLSFLEQDLWRQLHRVRNRLVFADAQQIARRLIGGSDAGRLRYLNRTYVLAPVKSDYAAHAKLLLFLREDSGLLAVGSGNLSLGGYASQGECFTTYRWSIDDDTHLSAFITARQFLDQLFDLGAVESVIQPRLQQAWGDAPWLFREPPPGDSPVRHNLDDSHLEQFVAALEGRQVDELVVHAPFYDRRCRAIEELLSATKPRRIQLLVQDRLTSVDPVRLGAVLEATHAEVDVRTVASEEDGAVLHAKFVLARCGSSDVCLQGSPNISTTALLEVHPKGNIELANLLVGPAGSFDQLVGDLVVSPTSVDLVDLHLQLIDDEGDEIVDDFVDVAELAWIAPRLTGRFGRVTTEPPSLLVAGELVDGVEWRLHASEGVFTDFGAVLPDKWAQRLERVEAISFEFADGISTRPCYPYHLNTLIALASGTTTADLIKQAGDFDVGDEELEELLLQLDQVLVVDGASIWRMMKKPGPASGDDEPELSLAYDDLDWDAIQSHPKLAQYRSWNAAGSAADPTALGVLLRSISDRLTSELARRRGEVDPLSDADRATSNDLFRVEVEDEDDADEQEDERERRRVGARSRARRQFATFIKRFVQGISDAEFVHHVGPSVIIPSYIVFNHICWRLLQLELADPLIIVRSQTAMWRFFWGDIGELGYLEHLSQPEQIAALEILEEQRAEAIMLCSLIDAYVVADDEGQESDLLAIRDVWRTLLDNPLWQPTAAAIIDASTLMEPVVESPEQLLNTLGHLAFEIGANEPAQIIADALGVPRGRVSITSVRVNRGSLGEQNVGAYVVRGDVLVSSDRVSEAFSHLRAILPDEVADYIRISMPDAEVVTFADFATETFVLADLGSNNIIDLDHPEPAPFTWSAGMDRMYALAG